MRGAIDRGAGRSQEPVDDAAGVRVRQDNHMAAAKCRISRDTGSGRVGERVKAEVFKSGGNI